MAARMDRQDWRYISGKKEQYDKEGITRTRWYNKMGQKLIDRHLENLKGPTRSRDDWAVVVKSPVEEEDKVPQTTIFQSKHQMENMAKALVAAQKDEVMRDSSDSPDTKLKAMLYRGLSHEDDGRIAYLRLRYRLNPTVRYDGHLPLTQWEHGRFQDMNPDYRQPASKFPMCHVLSNNFYRNGAFERQKVIAWPTQDQTRLKP